MNALIIYEEFRIAAQANALLKRASDRAGASADWTVKPWRLDMLRLPATAHEALRDGAEAHLLVLAIGRRAPLPEGLLAWLEGWATRRRVGDAALAVFDGGAPDRFSPAATSELTDFARRHGVSMICGEIRPAANEPARPWTDVHRGEVVHTATLVHILDHGSPGNYLHWGINE